jgi:SAM-dependent methyltransferase
MSGDGEDRDQATAIEQALRGRRNPTPRWTDELAEWSLDVTNAVVASARLGAGMHVLDVASGRGEPALTLASSLGARGRVVATDRSSTSLEAAEKRASELGIANLSVRVAAAESLPFAPDSFDVVTCQLGIALFDDPARALLEMRRVARRAGRVIIASWGPADSSAVYAATIGVIGAHVGTRIPHEGEPNPYRYGEAGLLSAELARAGFSGVQEVALPVELAWNGDVGGLWSMMRSTNAIFDLALGNLPDRERDSIVAEICSTLESRRRGRAVRLPAVLNVATAER